LSSYKYEIDIQPGDEATIPFLFVPELPGRIGMAVVVNHYDAGETLSHSLAYTGYIQIEGSDSLLDFESLFMYAMLAAGAGLVAWSMQGNEVKKVKKKKVVVVERSEAEKASDWLPQELKANPTSPKKKGKTN
jgi:hypothetical protein